MYYKGAMKETESPIRYRSLKTGKREKDTTEKV